MNRVLFGMPTLIELPDLAANVALCRQLGLSFVELSMELPACQPSSLPPEMLRDWRGKNEIDFTVHLPERLELAAFQEDVRRGNIACARRIIEWAGWAGISKLTMHLSRGTYFSLPDRKVWLYEKHRELFLDNLHKAMDELVSCAADARTTILIENTGNYRHLLMQEAVETLLSRHANNLGLTWDIGHDAESGYTDTPLIRRHMDRVAHMHLHDFNGKSAHQTLFSGAVDVPAMLDLARTQRASVVIETKTVQSLTDSVKALKARGLM